MATRAFLIVTSFFSILLLLRWRHNQIKLVGALRKALSPRVWYSSGRTVKGLPKPKPAKFARCLVQTLGGSKTGKIEVDYKEATVNGEQSVILTPLSPIVPTPEVAPLPESLQYQQPGTKVVLGHAQLESELSYANCPALDLGDSWTKIEEKHRKQYIGFASCVIIEDSENHILLIRRASHMRIFPECWVLPGGSVDSGESAREAGAREVLEEVGIRVNSSALTVVGMWESCYPVRATECIDKDPPFLAGHHLVVFFVCKLGEPHSQIKIELEEDESDKYTWITHSDLLKAIENRLLGREINGIYGCSTSTNGIGQGHAFILKEYLSIPSLIKNEL